jgi:hypothetical protein
VERSRDPIRLALEIDPEAEPLSGRIERGDRDGGRDFVGWSGLAAALTLLLDESKQSRGSDAPSGS